MSKNLRKLKVIPFYFFLSRFSTANKVLFAISFAVLITLLSGLWMTAENPTRWVTRVSKVYNQAPQEVMVKEIWANYRSMDFSLDGVQEEVYFKAEPIVQQEWMVWCFLATFILAWSLILTADTYNKTWLSYLIRGVFLAFLVFSGISDQLLESGGGWWIELGLGAVILFPTVLFRQKVIRGKFIFRFIIIGTLSLIPWAILYSSKGWIGLHSATVTTYPFFAFLLVPLLIFLGKEPNNLIFYFTSNLKNPKRRLKYPFVGAFFFILFAIEFVMLHNVLHWDFLPTTQLDISPIHLLMVAALFSVFTSQNLFPRYKDSITNAGMSFLILGFVILGISGIAFHIGTGDFLYKRQIERAVAIIFTTTSLFHFLYVTLNFLDLINQQVNYYYLIMRPRRMMYFLVTAGTVLFSLGLEASDGAKSIKLFYSTLYNRLGDQALLEGENREAYRLYEVATGTAAGTVKGHYNKAHLATIEFENPELAIESYGSATNYFPFPPAALNKSNILLATFRSIDARTTLRDNLKANPDPFVANNLGMLWKKEDQPDSAIVAFKTALKLAPEEAAIYGNLGNIYLNYGQPEWAGKFYRAGLDAKKKDPVAVANALLINLMEKDSFSVPDKLINDPVIGQDPGVRLNQSLYLYRSGQLKEAEVYLDSLLSKNETKEALLLHGMVMMEQGKVDLGLTRFQYLIGSETYREFRNNATHFMGMAYFQQGVPEMAGYYFSQAAENGISKDYFHWAEMLLDEGRQDSGFAVLRTARAKDSTLFQKAGREESMLHRAHGDVYSFLGGYLDNLKPDEYVRISNYAGQAGNFAFALDNFRTMINADSTTPVPYLEMGRIYLDYSNYDSAAVENLKFGLDKFPDYYPLKLELARAYISMGNLSAAMDLINSGGDQRVPNLEDSIEVLANSGVQEPTNHYQAERIGPSREWEMNHSRYLREYLLGKISLAKGDTTNALDQLMQLHRKQPLKTEVVLTLADIFIGKDLAFEGQQLLYEAIQRNHLNKDLWLKMAVLEKMAGREDESGNAALNAINLAQTEEEKLKIAGDFAEEIRFLKEQSSE